MTAKLINGTGLQLLRRYDHRPDNVQAALLEEVRVVGLSDEDLSLKLNYELYLLI